MASIGFAPKPFQQTKRWLPSIRPSIVAPGAARNTSAALAALPLGGPDLARLLARFEEQFAAAAATDRGTLFAAAGEAAATYRELPLLLLDVPMESAVEFEFANRLVAAAPDVLADLSKAEGGPRWWDRWKKRRGR